MNAWYATLKRPPLTPPDWIFGPVWSVLYLMIALAVVLFLRRRGAGKERWLLLLLVFHLVTNGVWTGIFFGLQSPGWALLDIALLDLSLVALIVAFWSRSRWSAILLIPYLLWVSFATYLNTAFWLLN